MSFHRRPRWPLVGSLNSWRSTVKRNLLGLLAVLSLVQVATEVIAHPSICCDPTTGACDPQYNCGCVGDDICSGIGQGWTCEPTTPQCQITDCSCLAGISEDCCVLIGGIPSPSCLCLSENEPQEQNCPDDEVIIPVGGSTVTQPIVFWVGIALEELNDEN